MAMLVACMLPSGFVDPAAGAAPGVWPMLVACMLPSGFPDPVAGAAGASGHGEAGQAKSFSMSSSWMSAAKALKNQRPSQESTTNSYPESPTGLRTELHEHEGHVGQVVQSESPAELEAELGFDEQTHAVDDTAFHNESPAELEAAHMGDTASQLESPAEDESSASMDSQPSGCGMSQGMFFLPLSSSPVLVAMRGRLNMVEARRPETNTILLVAARIAPKRLRDNNDHQRRQHQQRLPWQQQQQ